MRHRRRLLFAAIAACGALSAPAAHAADVVVGATSLASDQPQIAELGQNIPVFQGDASGNYALTAQISGTITSWGFMSAGIAPGHTFALRVLHPAGAGQYTATATSGTVTVDGTSGFQHDTVQGPFVSSVPIAAGDRIALQAIDDDHVPIEQGVQGADGFREFDAPFADGTTATLSAGATGDNGQVVPIQATITPANTPIAPVAPQVQVAPKITGTPSFGHQMTCDPGSFGGTAPITVTEEWTQVTRVTKRILGHFMTFNQATKIGTGPTITVANDLDPAFSSFTCEVTATNAAGSASATTPVVTVQYVAPTIAKHFVGLHLRPLLPVATVSAGGRRATCSTGTWRHFPTRFAYAWFLYRTAFNGRVVRKRIGTHRVQKVTAKYAGKPIGCRVYAINPAGKAFAFSSTVIDQ